MNTQNADPTTATLSQRLKDETWDMHQQAENGALARALVQGQISKEAFLGLVERERRLHASIDALISDARSNDESLSSLTQDRYAHEAEYNNDVQTLGGDTNGGETTAVTSAEAAIKEGAQGNPAFLIGVHYVREGAKNGNRMIEPRVRAAVGEGTTHLDPEGEQQRPNWMKFKATLDQLNMTPEREDAAIAGAIAMFRAVRDIHTEVMQQSN